MKTDQDKFWKGKFGNEYISRNNNKRLIASSISLFSNALKSTSTCVQSAIEFGCNIGINLSALHELLPDSDLSGVEINPDAASIARNNTNAEIFESSILDIDINKTYDLTFTKGVLIHINPNHLVDVYKKLYNYSDKYILVAEYYNPSPVSIDYRGHEERLFKRDFAGELMDMYQDLILVDYGFVYHKDTTFPQDDISWFLMSKRLS